MSRDAKGALVSGLLMLAVVLMSPPIRPARADALVVTRAMKASTIAEIFVEDGQIRVDLEIGAEDLKAFQNLLPDEVYEKVAGKPAAWKQRLRRFLDQDWQIRADDQALQASIDELELTKRIVRDEITGQPLPNQPDDAESVLRVQWHYPLQGKPQSLTIRPVRGADEFVQANIGFVVYHQGVAVNDFRYLSSEETLRLDWSDPWYSEFDRKTLRRRYFAPAAAFIYVENFEVRKEIVFRPRDLQHWIDLGLDGQTTISSDQRDEICEKVAAFLAEHTPLTIDGKPAEGTLDRIHFVNRTLKTTGVVPPESDIDMATAMIGAIYVYPIQSLPQRVSMQWDLFNQRIQQVPSVATDEAGGMPGNLAPDDPILVWQNYLKHPTVPAFLEVKPPARPATVPVSMITIVLLIAAAFVWFGNRRRGSREWSTLMWILLVLGIGAQFWPQLRTEILIGRAAELADEEAGEITRSLLHNVYRAFDYRDEERIYDVLDRSVSGDLLTKVYLETRQSLTLASQGGARVKVNQVDLLSCRATAADDDSFIATSDWTVQGSVGHWGHVHQRINRYRGEFTVQPIAGQWKLTKIELESEERL